MRAHDLGIPVNAGQMAPQNSFTKYASSALNQMPFSGNDPTAIQTGVNRAISNTIGEDATRITLNVMNARSCLGLGTSLTASRLDDD